jgi:hypothetical protein
MKSECASNVLSRGKRAGPANVAQRDSITLIQILMQRLKLTNVNPTKTGIMLRNIRGVMNDIRQLHRLRFGPSLDARDPKPSFAPDFHPRDAKYP